MEPKQEVKFEGLAILDAKNYGGFKDLDVNMAKLHFEHELPPGYSIVSRIGRGAFGCCFELWFRNKEIQGCILRKIRLS